MEIIDSRLLLLSLLFVFVNCESGHNFDLFIDSVATEDLVNSEPGVECELNGCTKIQFSLPDVKFWEVWKEDQNKEVDRSEQSTTDSPHWPNPPAIWGEAVMGKQSSTRPLPRPPYSSNFDIKPPQGPIITKLDKIVDILRPVSDQKQQSWLGFNSESKASVDQKPEARYDQTDHYYDYKLKPKSVDYLNDKNIDKRNLKKFIIEEKEGKPNRPEVIIKKRQKKPAIYIEEELVPVEEEEPKNEITYKVVKKPKPKPKTQHIIIEEEEEDENDSEGPVVKQEVFYQKKPQNREKIKEIYILANDDIKEEFAQKQIIMTTTTTTTPAPVTTRAPTTRASTTTMKPTKRQKKRKISVEAEDKEDFEDRRESEEYDQEYDYETDEEQTDEDEEAWGSASPETRIKPSRSKKQRNLNPFSVLRRLRPPPHHHHPYRHPQPHPSPHTNQHHSHNGGMVPGGTFRMRFYMDGPKYRESDDDPDY